MVHKLPHPLVRAIDLLNRRGKSVAVRLARYTGKSPHCVHPKHLADLPWHDWYIERLRPGDVGLDVGCANGAHTLRAAPHCKRIFGLDYDVGQLRIARQEAERFGLSNMHFFAWDITARFPFPDGFDIVLFLDVIEHLHPRVRVLREICRVLKDEGRLLISAPNRETSWRGQLREAGLFAYSDPDHKVEYNRTEFVAELAGGGFRLDGELMPVVYDAPWAGLIDALGGISLGFYARLARWKRDAALRHPEESTGFRAVALKGVR